uniref:Uncharacterized protein n=1 Tax=Hyaloperonospora arabidopsidis (strain Emoy2) TaxID=559515 RepID=M4BQC4_HYAAE
MWSLLWPTAFVKNSTSPYIIICALAAGRRDCAALLSLSTAHTKPPYGSSPGETRPGDVRGTGYVTPDLC